MASKSEPASKRRRIALACTACRTRKSKCDGKRPTCQSCLQLSLECQYDAPESSTNVIIGKQYVADLEQRLRLVEKALRKHDDLLVGHLSGCEPAMTKLPRRPRGDDHNDDDDDAASNDEVGREGEEEETSDDDGVGDPTKTDGLAITFVEEQAPVYFGESSNIRFVRYLLGAMSSLWGIKKPKGPSSITNKTIRKRHLDDAASQPSPRAVSSASAQLPPSEEFEELLHLFFNTTGLLFPIFHEPTFWGYYDRFKASGYKKIGRAWLGMLNMMMAMATNVGNGKSAGSKERFERSLVFYHRATALCASYALKTVSIESVQYLLLQTFYLQGTPRAVQAWNIHGLCVRNALALGLHCDQANSNLDPVAKETYKRTWQAIYCADKVMSVTFGRPGAVPDYYMVSGPIQQWPASDYPATKQHLETMRLKSELLRVSVQLYKVMGDSITRQYNSNLGLTSELDGVSTIQAATELRKQLRQWAATLPAEFALLDCDAPELVQPSIMNRIRTILTLRYHNLNIIIHRPLLCLTLQYLSKHEPSVELPYTAQLAMAEAFECVASAETTINIIAAGLGTAAGEETNLGVWFFTLYYGK